MKKIIIFVSVFVLFAFGNAGVITGAIHHPQQFIQWLMVGTLLVAVSVANILTILFWDNL